MINARAQNGALMECLTHKTKRTFKTRVSKPKDKCVVCYLCWLSDRLETSLYESDVQDIIGVISTFNGRLPTIKFIQGDKK